MQIRLLPKDKRRSIPVTDTATRADWENIKTNSRERWSTVTRVMYVAGWRYCLVEHSHCYCGSAYVCHTMCTYPKTAIWKKQTCQINEQSSLWLLNRLMKLYKVISLRLVLFLQRSIAYIPITRLDNFAALRKHEYERAWVEEIC